MRLHVGGKRGIRRGAEVDSLGHLPPHINLFPVATRVYGCPCFTQFAEYGCQVLGPHIPDPHQTPGDRTSDQVGTRLYPVRQHAIIGTVQAFDSLDDQRVGAGAGDPGAHLIQTVDQVHYLRFACCIFNNRLPIGKCGGHHQVFCAGDGYRLKNQPCTTQPCRPGTDVTVVDLHIGAHGTQTLDVDIHWS
ncbi:hypothetical protein MnTg04_00222 [bacterium MnTg04]|nr:hypothetical protein MnTg04_00222 [bacterium MnTg04]